MMFDFRLSKKLVLMGFVALTPLLLAGCSGGKDTKAGVVEGKVTVDGAPANSGSVVFNVNGQSISGQIKPDGTYKAVGVPAGAAQVSVTPPPKMPGPPPATKDMPGSDQVAKPVPIPAKYQDAKTSGLSTTIKGGNNTYNVELLSK